MTDTVAINDKFALDMKMGPTFQTTIQNLNGGFEDRNQDWPIARWRYDVELKNRPMAEIKAFLGHFLGRRGAAYAFPLKDPLYNELTDENIGTGDGTTDTFQIRSLHSDTDRPYYRFWYIVDNLVVKVAGVTKTVTTHYTESDGLVTFTSGNIPTAAQAITVSCDVWAKVRYEADYNPISLPVSTSATAPIASAGPFTLMEVPR
jgi:uncharacterized protein (TIGR02217 family)